jgi:hypothetical protein
VFSTAPHFGVLQPAHGLSPLFVTAPHGAAGTFLSPVTAAASHEAADASSSPYASAAPHQAAYLSSPYAAARAARGGWYRLLSYLGCLPPPGLWGSSAVTRYRAAEYCRQFQKLRYQQPYPAARLPPSKATGTEPGLALGIPHAHPSSSGPEEK